MLVCFLGRDLCTFHFFLFLASVLLYLQVCPARNQITIPISFPIILLTKNSQFEGLFTRRFLLQRPFLPLRIYIICARLGRMPPVPNGYGFGFRTRWTGKNHLGNLPPCLAVIMIRITGCQIIQTWSRCGGIRKRKN